MTTFTNAWDETLPTDAEDAKDGASRIRNFKIDVSERVEVDHSFAGDANDGAHKKVTLLEQAANPTNAANTGFLYTKDVSGATELFYEDEAGNVIQLTGAAAGLEWTTPAFSAANFTASGSMTWTVAEANVTCYKYRIVGKTMTVIFSIGNTTVGGTPDTTLQIKVPASKTGASTNDSNPCFVSDNGTASIGYALVSGTDILIRKVPITNWTAGTGQCIGQITFETTT